jgi:hypothetical protein
MYMYVYTHIKIINYFLVTIIHSLACQGLYTGGAGGADASTSTFVKGYVY